MPLINASDCERVDRTLILVSYRLPFWVKSKKRKNVRKSGNTLIESQYDFTESFDPLIDSVY